MDLPIENGGSFHSYVNVYQRVNVQTNPQIAELFFTKLCPWQSAGLLMIKSFEQIRSGRTNTHGLLHMFP